MIVPTPRNAMAIVKLSETWVSVQPVIATSGATNTLHPYAAPRQICITTAATAISQRLVVIRTPILPGCAADDLHLHALAAEPPRSPAVGNEEVDFVSF